MNDRLSIWTITDHPNDAPDFFVARRHQIEQGFSVATPDVIFSETLESLRERMLEMGLVCMPRQQGDDPIIVESWI